MTSAESASSAVHAAFSAIEHEHPLRIPLHYNVGHVGPRLDRLEAKTGYIGEYISWLEQRIAALEARLDRES